MFLVKASVHIKSLCRLVVDKASNLGQQHKETEYENSLKQFLYFYISDLVD